jgi:peptidoglycan/LPS O-acetylase OafA/YrhL
MTGQGASTTRANGAGRVTELDALRGIAAVTVMLYHFTRGYAELVPEARHLPFSADWGRFGVELFFAISGFVIFMTLNATGRASDFVVSRLARLYPAFWVSALVTFVAVGLFGPSAVQIPAADAIMNATMVPTMLSARMIDPSYWSLVIEVLFYAYMLAFWRLGLLGKIETVLLFWIGLKWVCALNETLSQTTGTFLIRNYIDFFVIGIAAYRVWSGDRHWYQQLPLASFTLLTVFILEPIEQSIVWLLVAGVMSALVLGRLEFLRHPALLWLGAISYPLYLVHQCVGYAVMWQMDGLDAPIALSAIAAGIVTISLAWAISVFVERPALVALRGAWRRQALALKPA